MPTINNISQEMTVDRWDELEEWLRGRPEIIRKLCSEFPPGTVITIDEIPHYVISYEESDAVRVSTTAPWDNYEEAVVTREPIHAHHLRAWIAAQNNSRE